MIEIVDALGQRLELRMPAARVVSLVPSETLSVVDLVGVERLVGRTDYCVEPEGLVEVVQTIGGTKSVDVQAVRALGPDLVLANKEENSRAAVTALIDAGLSVHVSFPCAVEASLEYLETLCAMLDVDPADAPHLRDCRAAVERAASASVLEPLPVFVPIWKDPWMTFDGRTYASDVLRACGARNVFSDRSRLYPLAADLGKRGPSSKGRDGERDSRYPRIRLEEIVERGARAVLLPDEPYAFTESDIQVFRELESTDELRVELVDGKDLFWYGTRMGAALDHLRERIARLSA